MQCVSMNDDAPTVNSNGQCYESNFKKQINLCCIFNIEIILGRSSLHNQFWPHISRVFVPNFIQRVFWFCLFFHLPLFSKSYFHNKIFAIILRLFCILIIKPLSFFQFICFFLFKMQFALYVRATNDSKFSREKREDINNNNVEK